MAIDGYIIKRQARRILNCLFSALSEKEEDLTRAFQGSELDSVIGINDGGRTAIRGGG